MKVLTKRSILMKVLTKLAATMVVFFCVAFVGAAESKASAKDVVGDAAGVVAKEALTRKHAQKGNPHCDEITERGLFFTQWSGRNCAGGVFRRGDTVMLVTSADRNADPERFARKLLPRHTGSYNFNTLLNRYVAVYYEVNRDRLHIGTGENAREARNLAEQSCRKSKNKCRQLLTGFNTWKPFNAVNPDHETIQFINVDGKGHSKCGREVKRKCKTR